MKSFEERQTEAGRLAWKQMLQDSGGERTSFERGYELGISNMKEIDRQQMEQMRIAAGVTQEEMCHVDHHNRKLRVMLFVAQATTLIFGLVYVSHMLFQHWMKQ